MRHRTRPVLLQYSPKVVSSIAFPLFLFVILWLVTAISVAAQPKRFPPPCHPNPFANRDMAAVATRGDVRHLPDALKDRLVELAGRPHSQLPTQAYAEAHQDKPPFAPKPSQLFQYYLLDAAGFEQNPFTSIIPGVNDTAMLTATGSNCGLPTIGAIRVVLEPKPGLPTDPGHVRACIDMFTDISGLFVINIDSGWYEGWMIHDVVVPTVARPRPDGHAQFGTITAADAAQLRVMGAGNNVPGNIFTVDGLAVHFPSDTDHFPDRQSNVVPVQLSLGAYNAMQQTDVHSYWEFNYTTNWVHPLYELPFTGGGFPNLVGGSDSLCPSIVPGSGPEGKKNKASVYGDNPNRPRDPDLFDAEIDSQREFRQRFIPSGLANEVFLDVYARPVSFEPGMKNLTQRLFKAYTAEVARVDQNGDGVISAAEGDVDEGSDGFADNTRLFITATAFNRVAITREINDSLLAPRFAPSQRGWVLTGLQVRVSPSVPASEGRD